MTHTTSLADALSAEFDRRYAAGRVAAREVLREPDPDVPDLFDLWADFQEKYGGDMAADFCDAVTPDKAATCGVEWVSRWRTFCEIHGEDRT